MFSKGKQFKNIFRQRCKKHSEVFTILGFDAKILCVCCDKLCPIYIMKSYLISSYVIQKLGGWTPCNEKYFVEYYFQKSISTCCRQKGKQKLSLILIVSSYIHLPINFLHFILILFACIFSYADYDKVEFCQKCTLVFIQNSSVNPFYKKYLQT